LYLNVKTKKLKNITLCISLFLFLLFSFLSIQAKADLLPKPVTQEQFINTSPQVSHLGQLLFFDPILSGNKNIACSTCHHPKFATGDGVSLSLGDGGQLLGPNRKPVSGNNRPEQRIGRHAPALFNLGAKEFKTMFHDGRLEADETRKSGIRTPLEDDMTLGFDSVLSAQSMFPVLSPDEMAGHYSENEISKAVRMGLITGDSGAWHKISQRIQAIPEYVTLFKKAMPHIKKEKDIQFTDISNALAEFIASEWQAVDSPFDSYLEGDAEKLSPNAEKGMKLFYGKANCSSCHSGIFQTDHDFHNIAIPEFGPGKVGRFETTPNDFGRERVTGNIQDRYKFRTPSLRNVALTAPYSHNGAFSTLESMIKHHLDPETSLKKYTFTQLIIPSLPEQDAKDLDKQRLLDSIPKLLENNDLKTVDLTDSQVDDLVAFMHSLTDSSKGLGKLGIPKSVPSGLAVE